MFFGIKAIFSKSLKLFSSVVDDIGYVICRPRNECAITIDQRKIEYLEEAQHIKEILVISEFDFPFPKFDILPRYGVVILQLQGFGVVNIIGLNLDLAWVGDLAIQIVRTKMYTRIEIWLKIGDGTKSWTIVAQHQNKYYFSIIFIQSLEY